MSDQHAASLPGRIAALEHMTGPSRGKVTWLDRIALDVSLGRNQVIEVSETIPGESRNDLIARLQIAENHYEIESVEGRPLWVNGKRVTDRRLEHHDMIEFGENGPLSRFFLYSEHQPVHRSVGDVLSDVVAYLRVSRRPIGARTFSAVRLILRRLTRETTILFRVGVVVAIGVLAALTYQQYRVNVLLQQQIYSGANQLEAFARALSRTRQEALTPGDLEALSREIGRRVVLYEERLVELEQRSGAGARVIARSVSSVVFLQGAYGFREKSSNRMLRLVVDAGGQPEISPRGRPLLSLEGDGPVAERQFTGTGFAVAEDGVLVTNRHVAQPWEDDANVEILAGQGFEPILTKFIIYVPGKPEPIPVELLHVSTDADLVLLRLQADGKLKGLRLADSPPAPGEEVILMGYPTGLRSMLAQAGKAFVETLQKAKVVGFWNIAARLAKEGRIAPLASRGIVGQVTAETVVYDAETTHGGSGGPVLNLAGSVVAVNAATMPKFGGSNFGIPVAKVRTLLKNAGLR